MEHGYSRWSFESRIDPSDLQVGHFVIRLDVPWSETRFPLQGVLIDNLEKRQWMIDNCAWVVISHVRSPNKFIPEKRLPPINDGARRRSDILPSFKPLSQGEINRETLSVSIGVYDTLDQHVHRLAEQFRQQGALDLDSASRVVGELAEVLESHMAALVWLTRIKRRDDYTAQHCVNVSILSIGLAHALDWDRRKVEQAGLAGLLHDLGKMQVSQEVLNKPGQLTEQEFEHIKLHAEFGFRMLREEGGLPDEVSEAVLCHHERPDGKGYSKGLDRRQIPPLARVVSIVDAYDAITSHRVYDPARSHHEALGILWKERDRQFDGPFVEAFTQFLGWVTPGTLVQLTSGDLAVVLQAREGRGLLPLVRLIEFDGKDYRLGAEMDLARLRPEVGDAPIRVAEVLPDGSQGVDIRSLSLDFGLPGCA